MHASKNGPKSGPTQMSEPHFEVPRLFKNEQNQRKSLGLFFAASGTGKFVREDLYSKINANPCVYFFSEPQIETPTCIYARYSKAGKENNDILETLSMSTEQNLCKKRRHF